MPVDARNDSTRIERQRAAAQENVDDHQRPHLGPGAGDRILRNLDVKNDGKINQERTGHQRDRHAPPRPIQLSNNDQDTKRRC